MKNLLVRLFWFLRLHEIARVLFQKNKTTILYYHDIEPKLFDKHLNYLKSKYTIVSLEDYVFKRIAPDSKYRLIITFDDGHVNNHHLLEIIKKHEVKCTIFLVSNVINTKRHFWFKWHKLDSKSKSILKKIENNERLVTLADEFGFHQDEEFDQPQALSAEQLEEMAPWISFQSHTHTHPCLNRCSQKESLFEISESKKRIEELLQNHVFALAYPNGDYEFKDTENAKRAGYSCVLTAKGYFNAAVFDTFELNRLSVNDYSSIQELALRSSGVYLKMKKYF